MGEQLGAPVKKSRPKYEWIIMLIVIVAGAAVAFGIHSAKQKTFKTGLMMSELSELRAAVTQYKFMNKVSPPDLDALVKGKYSFKEEAPRPYLTNIKPDKAGKLVDPFGNPYKYDPQKGTIQTVTKGFEQW